MGRPTKGYTIRWRDSGPSVRFTHAGKPYDLGLGTRDREQAGREAARIYAEIVSGQRQPDSTQLVIEGHAITKVGGEWLDERGKRLRANTREIYEGYIVRLAASLPFVEDFTEQNLERYALDRLCHVQKATVRHELSAARQILKYAYRHHYISSRPQFPELDRSERGTKYEHRRRTKAEPMSQGEVQKLLAAMPEWSRSRKGNPHPVRARFVLAYELALRPSLVDKLSVPQHWRPGAKEIWITQDTDKTKKGRPIPLTPRALAALESVAPESGLIFGKHDYRERLRAAAVVAFGKHDPRVDTFCGQHLRSAGGTHLLEITNDLTGVQQVMGHTKVDTTARYMRTSERQAAKVINIAGRKRR